MEQPTPVEGCRKCIFKPSSSLVRDFVDYAKKENASQMEASATCDVCDFIVMCKRSRDLKADFHSHFKLHYKANRKNDQPICCDSCDKLLRHSDNQSHACFRLFQARQAGKWICDDCGYCPSACVFKAVKKNLKLHVLAHQDQRRKFPLPMKLKNQKKTTGKTRICNICNKPCKGWFQCKEHSCFRPFLRTMRIFACDDCPSTSFSQKNFLKNHVQSGTHVGRLVLCANCQKSRSPMEGCKRCIFKPASTRVGHFMNCTKENASQMEASATCDVCDFIVVCKRPRDLKVDFHSHFKLHYKTAPNRKNDQPICCDSCGKLLRQRDYQSHACFRLFQARQTGKWICDDCGYCPSACVFKEVKKNLKLHVQAHQDQGRKLQLPTKLKNQKKQARKTRLCDICTKPCKGWLQCKEHSCFRPFMRSDRRFACDDCPLKSFSKRTLLKHHVKKRHLSRQIRCANCRKSRRPMKDCERCIKRTSRLGDFVKLSKATPHRKVASFCFDCGKVVKCLKSVLYVRHILPNHMKVRRYHCALCVKQFFLIHHLDAHVLAVHKKTQPFLCFDCKRPFSLKQKLFWHQRDIHKNIV